MALMNLTEGNKYSRTTLDKLVIDRLIKDDDVMPVLPFEELLGNSLTYNTITTDSLASFKNVGDTWSESTPELTQATVTLKILGDDADVDNFIIKTRSNEIDITGTVIDNKIKAVQHKFLDTFFYGSVSTDAREFNGLHALMSSTTYNTVHAGSSTGTALSIAKLREAIDLLPKMWRTGVTAMFMSKAMRRGISVYLDSIGDKFARPGGTTAWGNYVDVFDGIPVLTSDHILNTETASSGAYAAKTGGANTSIFILSFAPQAVCGVQASDGIELIPIGQLEDKDATRYRVRWYCGLKFEDLRSAAKVDGIVAAGTVVA